MRALAGDRNSFNNQGRLLKLEARVSPVASDSQAASHGWLAMSTQIYSSGVSVGQYRPLASKHLTEVAQTLIKSIARFLPQLGICQSLLDSSL